MKGIKYLICAVAVLFSLNCKSTYGIQNITLEQSEVIKAYFEKGMLDNTTISKKHDFNTLTLSVPILSNDGEYALMYVESTGGGDLVVFKKIDEKWKANYVLSDWIS